MKKSVFNFFIVVIIIFICCCNLPEGSSNGSSGNDSTVYGPPASPTNFTLIETSDNCILIKWTDNANNEDEYLVHRSLSPDFTVYEEFSLPANSVYFRDSDGLAETTDYYYQVIASNSIGTAPAEDNLSATTKATTSVPSGKLVADHTIINLIKNGEIPITAIEAAKLNLVIAYGHTSHGSQITSGMSGLVSFANAGNCDGTYTYSAITNLFNRTQDGSGGSLQLSDGIMRADCGYYSTALTYAQYELAMDAYKAGTGPAPDANWEYETRYFLGPPDAAGRGSRNPEYNVVIWSWCGQASGRTQTAMEDTYLHPMDSLETDYPGIIFVYMTGHLNGDGAYHTPNDYIRDYCATNGKWLFDFADIESYDPDGIIYTVGTITSTDGCVYDFDEDGNIEKNGDTTPVNGDRNWGFDWQNDHVAYPENNADWYNCGAAHSAPVNANMKAYAAWWLWCRLAGWDL